MTVGLLGATATFGPLAAGIPIVISLGVVTIAASAIGVLCRTWAKRRATGDAVAATASDGPVAKWRPVHNVAVGLMAAAAAAIGALIVYRASNYFVDVPQWWDAMFHASAIRFIADTGNTHPAAMAAISHTGATNYFYPNGYHILGAALLQALGTDVPHVINAINAIIPGIFAMSMTALAKSFGLRPALCASIAFLSFAFMSFPYDLIVWGPVFPYAVGLALVPAWLALFNEALRKRRILLAILVGLGATGLLSVHPAAGIAAALLALGLVSQRWVELRAIPSVDLGTLALIAVTVITFSFPIVLGVLGASAGSPVDWPTSHSPSGAVGDLLTQSRGRSFPPWWLVGLAILGLTRVRQIRSLHWYLVGGIFFGILFVMAASYEGRIVALTTGPWWNDGWRLAALFTPAMLVVAANGCVLICDIVLATLRSLRIGSSHLWRTQRVLFSAPVLIVTYLVLLTVTDGLYQQDNINRVSQLYPDGPTVSQGELVALDRIGETVPAGALVMNDPQDGSAWMWALEGVQPVFGAAVVLGRESSGLSESQILLYRHFNEIDNNPSVLDAVKKLRIQYVYVGEGFVDGGNSRAPGLKNLDDVELLEPVFDYPEARLYRIALPTGPGSPY